MTHPLKSLGALVLSISFASLAVAQMSPVGIWHTVDDKTGEIKSEVSIVEQGGVLSGTVTKLLSKTAKQDAVCDKCSDDRKDKPVLGLQILRNVKKNPDQPYWDGGRVLDPENGSTYAARLTPIDGGAKLEMRGSIGPFGRTQTWVRVK